MSRLLAVSILAVSMAGPSGVLAMHDPDITNAEFKCQLAGGKAIPKYQRSVLKCVTKCFVGFFNDVNPVSDCYPPYGGVTAACTDIGGTAGTKLRQSIEKACDPATNPNADCPECYDAAVGNAGCGEGGYANDEEQAMSSQVATTLTTFLCKTTGASKAEEKCQANATKAEGKLIGSIYKCYGKCFSAAHAGTGTAADCTPNPILPNDPTTQNCLSAAELKAGATIDKLCSAIGVNVQCPPYCESNVQCDSFPNAGDGICSNRNCTSGYTFTTPYPSGSNFALLVMNAWASNIVYGNLGPDSGTYCGE
jgi:hypothetical protein